ncbi:discoidin domain-containing protein [Aliiglaciecola sp. CAU 1673]|uniref:discoidin domain-containing protein n=1 Tax=Aliiglaciecola sp. CAU 1673 TaxID=3032595 RepID=UPI0023DA9AEF|nr:discoidin domain-containing protein [Aliiglaciecola sp. CAU 1673]MDF2177956.1 discoidin domain-containing protein [Aliiglaciecola sp. CAU 1673]
MQMRPIAAGLTLAITLAAGAEPQEYRGKITDLAVAKSGMVRLDVDQDEDNRLQCPDGDWPLEFSLEQAYTDKWLDFLMLARNTNQTVRIGYETATDKNCQVDYVAVRREDGFGNGTGIGEEGGKLIETGALGNVALINTNGLTASSYSANSHYSGDVAAAAFDGHTWSEQVNADAGDKVNRGLWLVRKESGVTPYIQVDFGQKVKVSGLRVILNEKASELGRGPQEITIQASLDGESFANHEYFRLAKSPDQTGSLTSAIELKVLRLQIHSNFGDANFIEIDELEIYQATN